MSTNNLTLKIFFRKGSLLLNRKTKFPRKVILPKYFVLLENYQSSANTLLGITTTSKLWRLQKNNNEGIIISIRSLRGPTLLLWDNIREIPVKGLLSNNYEHVGFLANMKRVDDKIKRSKKIPKDIKRRILKSEIKVRPVKTKKRKDIYRNFTKEQVDKIKRKLGLKR